MIGFARRWRHGRETVSTLGPYAVSRTWLAACAFGPRAVRRRLSLGCDFTIGGVTLRARAEDFVAVEEVFRRGEYDVVLARVPPERLTTVLDLGANIGCFAAAVFRRFPLARVHSVEASADTCRLLALNSTRNRGFDWRTVHAAVWPHTGPVYVSAGGASTGRRVSAAGGERVAAITLEEAVDQVARSGRVTLCKMDIEGAEQGVLAVSTATLARIERLIVEVHAPASDADTVQALLTTAYPHVTRLPGRQSAKPLFYATSEPDAA